MKTDTKRHFETDNISLASYLLTQGMTLVDVVEETPEHFVFLFSDSEKCFELKRGYLNNTPAPARELFSKREMLITEIKSKSVCKAS